VNNGKADIKSVLLTPVAVNKTNIASTVIADGFWSKADICTAAYATACTAAGIN
jgi:D-xylose transport system substrate-binding protein